MESKAGRKKPVQAMTIHDIARMADVSIGTVSRVINNSSLVKEETRRKVNKIIHDTGFKPNAAARSMIKKKSSIVGVIVPEINNPHLADLVVVIEEILSREKLSVLLCNSGYNIEKETGFINELISRNAEGLVLIASELGDKAVIDRIGQHLEVVSIGAKIGNFDCVDSTNWQGAFDMVEYLITLGHERIACIGFNKTAKPSIERLNGYIDALRKHGINARDEYMLGTEGTKTSGYAKASKLLELKSPPTAVFAINDYYAINAYLAVQDKSLTVGRDISIAGFDDIPIARLVNPALTTVRYSTRSMAELATDLLLKRIKKFGTGESKRILLPTEIVKRESAQPFMKNDY